MLLRLLRLISLLRCWCCSNKFRHLNDSLKNLNWLRAIWRVVKRVHTPAHTKIRLKNVKQTHVKKKKKNSETIWRRWNDMYAKSFGLFCMQYCHTADYPMYGSQNKEEKTPLPIRHLPLFLFELYEKKPMPLCRSFLMKSAQRNLNCERRPSNTLRWIKLEHFILFSVYVHTYKCIHRGFMH